MIIFLVFIIISKAIVGGKGKETYGYFSLLNRIELETKTVWDLSKDFHCGGGNMETDIKISDSISQNATKSNKASPFKVPVTTLVSLYFCFESGGQT